MRYPLALQFANDLMERLRSGCERLEIVGSVKRNDKPDVHDIEILVIPDLRIPRPEFGQKDPPTNMLDKVLLELVYEGVLWPVKGGTKYKQFILPAAESLNPFHLDLFIVNPVTWGIQNVIRTGPSIFSHRFVTNQSATCFVKETGRTYSGLLPDRYQYIRGETRIKQVDRYLDLPEEKDALELLGLGWIAPRDRRKYIDYSPSVAPI